MTRGRFITLEGLDGAGKTTHLDWLRQYFESRGVKVRVTREPGGTSAGESLRKLLLEGTERLHPETETLLMFAARREHLDKVILPALSRGEWVLSDRFTDASYAYQAGGSGVDWEKVATLERWTVGDTEPDLTLYFDVTPDVGRSRAGAVRTADRFEQEEAAFYERVRAAYLRRAGESAERIRVVDATRTIGEIQAELERTIASLFSR